MPSTAEVVICTFNGSAYVIEQLRSIVEQTMPVAKVSIYDDGSTDDTVIRIRDFIASRADRDRFHLKVNPRNLGYAENFMQGIAAATGDIVFLSDQDDIWEATKVQAMMNVFDTRRPDMVFSDGSFIDQAGVTIGRASVLQSYGLSARLIRSFHEHAFELLSRRNYISGSAAAVRRTAAQSALPLPCNMPHDYWLAIWCSLHGGVVAISERLYRYRQHRNNVIGGLSSANPLYVLLGIWRQPDLPRERELTIWRAVTERIAALPCPAQVAAAHRKLEWLSRVVPREKKSLSRVLAILGSAINGSYRRHSAEYALLRDVVSLIK